MSTAPKSDTVERMTSYVAAHQQTVYTFCYWAIGQDKRAQEVTQRVFERAWPPVHPSGSLAETKRLLAVAYHAALVALPKGRPATGTSHPRPAPGDGRRIDVGSLLDTLPSEVRCLAVLRYCCVLTPGEISEIAGLPVSEVRESLLCACRALMPLLLSPPQSFQEQVRGTAHPLATAATLSQ